MPNAANIPDQFEYVDSVPVFDAHAEYAEDGSKVRQFDRDRLQSACDYYNARAEKRKHYGVIGPGHTILQGPDGLPVPEMRQPPAWGIHANHRVESLPDGTPAIMIDRYAKRGEVPDGIGGKVNAADAIKQIPYTSVEYWTKDGDGKRIPGYIGRVALLNQDPKRDCGTFMYSKASVVPVPRSKPTYATPDRSRSLAATPVKWGKGEALFYSLEAPTMFDDTDDMNDPAAAPSVGSLSADDLKALVEYLKTAGFQMAPIEPVVDIDPAMDAPGGDMPLPGGLDAPGGAPPAPAMFSKANGRVKPSEKGVLALRERELRDALARIAALEKNNQEAVEVYSKSDAEARAERIQSNGKSIKYEKVVERFSKMIDRTGKIDKAARDEYEEELMETAAPATMYSKHLPPAVPIDTRGPQRTGKDQPMSEADLQAKLDAMRRSGETDFSKYAKSSN